MQQFDFVHCYLDGVLVATPVGEIDRVAAAELRHELLIHLTQPGEPVVVRLDRVSSLDFAGVCALIGAYREASMRHLGFCLATPGPAIAEVLSGTNVASDIPMFATLREAVDAATQRTKRHQPELGAEVSIGAASHEHGVVVNELAGAGGLGRARRS